MIAVIIVAMAVAINQSNNFINKSYLLKQPCELCTQFNPSLKSCFQETLYKNQALKKLNISSFNFTLP